MKKPKIDSKRILCTLLTLIMALALISTAPLTVIAADDEPITNDEDIITNNVEPPEPVSTAPLMTTAVDNELIIEDGETITGNVEPPDPAQNLTSILTGLGSNITIEGNVIGFATIRGTFGNISGNIENTETTISADINSVGGFIHGSLGVTISGNIGTVTGGISSIVNITIQNPITVIGTATTPAFTMQPTIGIPNYVATWSTNVDGSNPTSGSEYVWSADHRWVRFEIGDETEMNESEIIYTDDDTGITLIAPPGTVPDGTTLRVEPVTEGGNFQIINNALAQTADKFAAFDISLISAAGQVIQPQPGTSVTILLPREVWQGFNMNKLAVYHVGADETLTLVRPWPVQMDGTNDNIILQISSFSFFAVVELTDEALAALLAEQEQEQEPTPQVRGESNVPQTGDSASTLLWTALLSLSIAGITIVVVWQRKRQHNKS